MADALVTYAVTDVHIARITLDAPARRNALSDAMLDQLIGACERARDDDEVRVVVIGTSHERIFSAGGDLRALASDSSAVEKFADLDRFPRLVSLIGKLHKPVICAAGGDVLAGAFGLALACDFIIAKDGVSFGCPEINVGLFPFMISALIYRNLPRMKANELMLLGKPVTAAEALTWGFVNRVVPAAQFDGAVTEWARELAGTSPLLMRMGKDALDATGDLALPEALDALRAQLALAFTTADIREGVTAFLERREPRWTGR